MIAPSPLHLKWTWECAGHPWEVHAVVTRGEVEDLYLTAPGHDFEMTVEDVGGTVADEERLSEEAQHRAVDAARDLSNEAAFERAKGRE